MFSNHQTNRFQRLTDLSDYVVILVNILPNQSSAPIAVYHCQRYKVGRHGRILAEILREIADQAVEHNACFMCWTYLCVELIRHCVVCRLTLAFDVFDNKDTDIKYSPLNKKTC